MSTFLASAASASSTLMEDEDRHSSGSSYAPKGKLFGPLDKNVSKFSSDRNDGSAQMSAWLVSVDKAMRLNPGPKGAGASQAAKQAAYRLRSRAQIPKTITTRLSTGRAPLTAAAPTVSPTGTRQQITEAVPTIRAIMSGQQPEKTRERAPANLGVKFNPNLGAANMKRFHATVRALLKSNEQSGDLALAILEGWALLPLEPRVRPLVGHF